MSFGDNVRKIREKRGLSQAALGAKMGLQGSVIGRYELNEATPKPDRIVAFAYALDTSPNELLDFTERETDLMQYAKKYLDNITIESDTVKVKFVTTDKRDYIFHLPISEFLHIMAIVHANTEKVIAESSEINRKSLCQLAFDGKIFNDYILHKTFK